MPDQKTTDQQTTDQQTQEQPGPLQGEVVNGDHTPDRETINEPQKLIRIASMVRTMLDEVRRAPLDEAGRRHLTEIHARSLAALEDVLSEDLRKELTEVVIPFTGDSPTESELRIAQAQLVGWLEGLFHGIQATLFSQQAAAMAQFEEMRKRPALEAPSRNADGTIATPGPHGYL